jgi:hypothetical protein
MIAHLISSISALPTDSSALISAISALESSVEALERSSEGLEPWISRFTWLVAIGVALEIVVVLIDHREDVNEWRRCLLHPERPSTLKLWLEIASVVLVTVGILGELGVGLGISSINGKLRAQSRLLRSKSDQLLALVTQETSDANVRAAANEREAAQLRKDAEREQLARVQLKAKVTDDSNRVEKLRQENNEAAAKLEAEKAKRLELATSLLPREFMKQDEPIEKLQSFPRMKVVFELIDEREPISIAEQINFVIVGANWKSWRRRGNEPLIEDGIEISPGTKFPSPSSDSESVMRYLELREQQSANAEKAIALLRNALFASGIESEIKNNGYDFPTDTLLIRIGPKPNHALENAIRELAGSSRTPTVHGALNMNRAGIPDDPQRQEHITINPK